MRANVHTTGQRADGQRANGPTGQRIYGPTDVRGIWKQVILSVNMEHVDIAACLFFTLAMSHF